MERASRLIGRLKISGESLNPEELALAAWPSAVGSKVAAHTRALKMVRSSLIVEVEDLIWQRQLFVLRHQILKNLAARLGAPLVEDVQFRIVPLRRQPQRATSSTGQPLASDEADGISDPVLRRIYKASRKKALG